MSIDVDLFCSECSETLAHERINDWDKYVVEPCKRCIMDARTEAFDEGFSEGREVGEESK